MDFDSTDAPSGPPRYENSFGSVRICHCRSRLAVTPKARLLSPAAIFQETCFFGGEGGPPSPGAHVLYIIGERKTGVPTEKTATNNKVFGLRQFRCTITAVRVQKVPRYRSDFETHATSGCHTEGPICSVHVCFFSGPGWGPICSFFHVPGSAKKNRGGASSPGQLLDIKYYCLKPQCLCNL